jgi:hypothetical protein
MVRETGTSAETGTGHFPFQSVNSEQRRVPPYEYRVFILKTADGSYLPIYGEWAEKFTGIGFSLIGHDIKEL